MFIELENENHLKKSISESERQNKGQKANYIFFVMNVDDCLNC